ncbi:hypothetical protein LINGRAHAP2_LOCUS10180 [Linum grandiflorum]
MSNITSQLKKEEDDLLKSKQEALTTPQQPSLSIKEITSIEKLLSGLTKMIESRFDDIEVADPRLIFVFRSDGNNHLPLCGRPRGRGREIGGGGRSGRAGRGAATDSTEAVTTHPGTTPTSSTVAPSASATVESIASAPKKRKPTKKRSPYWIHYDCIIDEDVISKAECKYCKTLICADSSNNGTSGLIAHYKRCPARLDDDQMALNLQ